MLSDGGGHNDHFTIGETTGNIISVRPFDYETVQVVTLNVSVEDCSISLNISEACGREENKGQNGAQNQKVNVNVTDMNDNPPWFTTKEITFGMRRITAEGTTLELSLKVGK